MYSCFSTMPVHTDGPVTISLVKERVLQEGNDREIRDFEVFYNQVTSEVRCICGCFNLYSFLCRHTLCVLNFNGAEEVLRKYILSRWKKDYKRLCLVPECGTEGLDTTKGVQWFDQLCRSALQVVEEGAISLDHYKAALLVFEESLERVHGIEGKLDQPSSVT